MTCVLIALAALLARAAEAWLDPQSLALFFVVPIVVAAIRYGLWASLGAALLSALAINYLYVEPRYTFVVARAQDAAALLLFSLVGALVSAIAARARAAALDAERRAREALLLQSLATRLAASGAEDEIADAVVDSLSALSGRAALLVDASDRHWGSGFGDAARAAARWSMSTKQPFTPSLDAPSPSSWAFWPVVFAGRSEMALGVNAAEPLAPEIRRAAEQITAQAGVAMERARVARTAEAARLEVERERLKTELLAGVSHDLRTPLSMIVFTLQSLQRFAADHPPETRDELLALAEAEARRLAEMVDTLLDASRIGVAAAPVRIETIAPRDLIARLRAEYAPSANIVDAQVAENLPLISADLELAVRALANVVSNALRHGGAPVRIVASRRGGEVVIEISDTGPGLGDDPARLFERFVRGAPDDGRAPGLGLGLTMARRFLEAQGARIVAANRPEGGAVFTITFAAAVKEVVYVG
ncbi:sensor histidine kinase [Terricaulis silvestris]|uniref:histidine kinase n=1 Tax=Terricaulis silvestris TaxID=2686094 RepID=A0A6I6MH82_9CAUL|nr:DUF4118 domain-containing protein [Terricaulis silvestris]QGZ94170.1 Sensor protein KdpD [Terricaulis silvestris]